MLQNLINFIRNTKYACDDGPNTTDKVITVGIAPTPEGQSVRLSVGDNGIGIPPENLMRAFNHGFTTRKEGHRFGLHSSANARKEMKGTNSVRSDGPSKGSTFMLDLSLTPAEPVATA